MTSPDGSRGSSPLRVGGLALLGVGVVAGILGVVGLNSGGGTPPPVAAPSLSTAATPSESAEAAAPTSAPAETAPRRDRAPAAAPRRPPPPPAPPPAAPRRRRRRRRPRPPPPGPARPAPARVPGRPPAPARGRCVRRGPDGGARLQQQHDQRPGRARRRRLPRRRLDGRRGGQLPVVEGIIPTSTVYYRPGTGEQGSAERIGSEFGLRAAPRFAGLTDASPGLIVIVTNDYQKR